MWLPWILLDVVGNGIRTIQQAQPSGGEARGQARIRRNPTEAAATAATTFLVIAVLHRLVRIVYDSTAIIDSMKMSADSGGTNAVDVWNGAPAGVRDAVTGACSGDDGPSPRTP